VLGLKNVLDSQESNIDLQHIFFVSSTRVYGQKTNKILDEQDIAIPNDFGGERLLEAENLLKQVRCQTTSLRLSGIYGKNRLYLLNLSKDISYWPMHNSYSNRIHRDDAARFIAFLCDKVLNKEEVDDCYIVTDNLPTLQYDVLIWLAGKQGVDTSRIKTPQIKGGKQLSNLRLRETDFKLQYPNFKNGYTEIMQHA
jgi:nucleoside-diphosphate-sugar epimerase